MTGLRAGCHLPKEFWGGLCPDMAPSILGLIDYGSGNLHSVQHALSRAARDLEADIQIRLITRSDELASADYIVLPGVGHFADCKSGLFGCEGMVDALEEMVLRKGRPFLGICVGMQLLAEAGYEGGTPTSGLGWMKGAVEKIPAVSSSDISLKIPHMGWNRISLSSPHHPVLKQVDADSYFYFVHSYYVAKMETEQVLATTSYGVDIPAIIGQDNMIATQFHPEKSQKAGQEFLRGFLSWSV